MSLIQFFELEKRKMVLERSRWDLSKTVVRSRIPSTHIQYSSLAIVENFAKMTLRGRFRLVLCSSLSRIFYVRRNVGRTASDRFFQSINHWFLSSHYKRIYFDWLIISISSILIVVWTLKKNINIEVPFKWKNYSISG